MGSNQFQREYIEYLQERNNELMGRLNHMKENYENKILSKDLKRHYLISTFEDVLNVCTQIPQEIDLFFDKMTAAMEVLKSVLLRKCEMVQLVEKISKVMNTIDNHGGDFITAEDPNLLQEPLRDSKNKKMGTVRVSPMINGHVISTEPRIYLSRVPEGFTPRSRFDTHQLSPIVEASPNTSSDLSNKEGNSFREVTIPLERLNLKKMSYNYLNEESPKSRFKGPKKWKKSLSSTKQQSENARVPVYMENKEILNKKFPIGDIENVDPLEGPSWLYNENEGNPSLNCFMDYRRRKHRFATVFDLNENYDSSSAGKVYRFSLGDENENKDSNEKCYDENEVDDSEDENEAAGGNESKNVSACKGEDGNENNKGDNNKNGKDDGSGDEKIYVNHKTSNVGKKDFKKVGINESSEDLFSESYVKEEIRESISSSFKKNSSSNLGKNSKEGGKDSENNNNTLETSTCESLVDKKRNILVPKQIHFTDENDNKTRKTKRLKKPRKCPDSLSESLCKEMVCEASVKKLPRKPNSKSKKCVSDNESEIAEKTESWLIKDALEKQVFVKLENCSMRREIAAETSKPNSPSDTVSLSVSSPSQSVETEGRQKRKAALKLKLVEPSLRVKLRRT